MSLPEPTLYLDSRPPPLKYWLTAIWRFRGVLLTLSRKDFQVRYKRTSLGVLWSVTIPILQSVVLVFIFSRVGRFGTGRTYSYAGFVLAGMVVWIYISTSVLTATTAIVDASGLTDKVWFPRVILTLVPPCANLVTLAVSALIVLVASPFLGVVLGGRILLMVPVALLAITFTCALGMVLGALYVYFRDVKFLVQAVLLVWLYLTPVVYPASALGHAGRWLDLNPLTGMTALFQTAAVGAPGPSARAIAVSVGCTVALVILAVAVQWRRDRLFVDLL